jgi:hypothetical protein
MDHARESSAIVDALFPEQVRDRLFRRSSEDGGSVNAGGEQNERRSSGSPSNTAAGAGADQPVETVVTSGSETLFNEGARLRTFLSGNENSKVDRPIADLFPRCTVLFADIAVSFVPVSVATITYLCSHCGLSTHSI